MTQTNNNAPSRLRKTVSWVLALVFLWMFWDVGQAALNQGSVPLGVHVTRYTVQSGETLWTIAERLDPDANPNATIDWVMARNPGFYGDVHPGQVITVPEEVK